MVGWALILEYALGASAVAVGWSGHFVGALPIAASIPGDDQQRRRLMAKVALAFGAKATPIC